MLRKILQPRLWLLLILPLAFYLTRSVRAIDSSKRFAGAQVISIEQYQSNLQRYSLVEYCAFGKGYDPNPYQVWQFIANACLVIGCLSVGKELLWTNIKQ